MVVPDWGLYTHLPTPENEETHRIQAARMLTVHTEMKRSGYQLQSFRYYRLLLNKQPYYEPTLLKYLSKSNRSNDSDIRKT